MFAPDCPARRRRWSARPRLRGRELDFVTLSRVTERAPSCRLLAFCRGRGIQQQGWFYSLSFGGVEDGIGEVTQPGNSFTSLVRQI